MAVRPLFLPTTAGAELVREIPVEFRWNPGMAVSQKRKNVQALHEAAQSAVVGPVLEISSNSEVELGRRLSAFSLKIELPTGPIPFESAYQGSKVFARGGPFVDLYRVDARAAKKDERIRSSGRIVGFRFLEHDFPSDPPTAFYDWMYICALYPHADWLRRLDGFAAFSDIAFNPDRSLNCQARALAIFMSLKHRNLVGMAAESFDAYLRLAHQTEYQIKAQWMRAGGAL